MPLLKTSKISNSEEKSLKKIKLTDNIKIDKNLSFKISYYHRGSAGFHEITTFDVAKLIYEENGRKKEEEIIRFRVDWDDVYTKYMKITKTKFCFTLFRANNIDILEDIVRLYAAAKILTVMTGDFEYEESWLRMVLRMAGLLPKHTIQTRECH